MIPQLSELEQRVLGAMIEKDMATPEYYPLSLNALTNACNQKNNREPVTSYDEETVEAGHTELRGKRLAVIITGSGRVPKYGHRAQETLNLSNRELALLAVLLLRGPQTLNELKDRCHRLHAFEDLDSVESALKKMIDRELAVFLPKQSGWREPRYMHLLGGPVDMAALAEAPAGRGAAPSNDRVTQLEIQVEALRAELEQLRQEFSAFRTQFQ
ncbi:MAG: YceH family protein [bacterium]